MIVMPEAGSIDHKLLYTVALFSKRGKCWQLFRLKGCMMMFNLHALVQETRISLAFKVIINTTDLFHVIKRTIFACS